MPEDDLFGEDGHGDEAVDDFNRLTDILFQRIDEFAERNNRRRVIEMRKTFRRLGQIVGGNCRQHAARYAPVQRFGEFEADRAKAGDGDAQRGFLMSHGVLTFALQEICHS